MVSGDRSLADVLQDIIRNVQEIVRSEVRLAKTEIKQETVKAKSAATLLGAGAITALFAILFLLLTAASSLALIVPVWAATLIVGAVLALIGSVLVSAGMKRFKKVHPVPEKAAAAIKENFEWAKPHTK
jgi:uncharacterized membrane protein YqjE